MRTFVGASLRIAIVGALAVVSGQSFSAFPGAIQRESAGQDAFRPPVVRFGSTVADVRAAVGSQCKAVTVRKISPPFVVLRSHVKHEQVQLDCDGFSFEGAPRWAEFVFADDSLELVWIMTKADDERALRAKMTAAYGAPDKQNEKFTAFTKATSAIRIDVPEVLFYSSRIAPQLEGWFATPSTFR